MRIAALVVAAGRGLRAGLGQPKQYVDLGGMPVLARILRAFLLHPRIETVLCVIHPQDATAYDAAVRHLPSARLLPAVAGAETRQASVHAGLEALAIHPPDVVLIHDAARPFLAAALIDRAIAAAEAHGAAAPALPVADSMAEADEQMLVRHLPRARLRAIQTPQAFRYPLILEAHRQAVARAETFTDDAGIAAAAGHPVHLFAGDVANYKLTEAADFARARRDLGERMRTVVATGYDVHAFRPGDAVVLGGVSIAHDHALDGHSDADVVLHALTDAVLGCIADGDIGQHFPPTDPRWRGAASDRFLAHAVAVLRARGGLLDHLDATVVCEAPKIGPHRAAMRARIAAICDIPVASVSVKATTSERLGFTGRREGIAALATATARLPG
jgi:2-C-methyl-D-erythritol 4-phosphate cytidylyltransferase/2-C-methyl-D-erythritol 2,4-cyclodiphosphate synthase